MVCALIRTKAFQGSQTTAINKSVEQRLHTGKKGNHY